MNEILGQSFLTKCCVEDNVNASPNCSDVPTSSSNVGATWVGSTGDVYIRITKSTPCSASDWTQIPLGGGGAADGVVDGGSVTGGNIVLTRTLGLSDVSFALGSIEEHNDVVITLPASGNVLTYDGADWVNLPPATGADGVVDGGSVTGGNIVLTRTLGLPDVSFALGSIDEHSDVDTTTAAPTDGQVLTWVNANSAWEPATPSGGGSTASVSASNGNSESVGAFSTLTYAQFVTAQSTSQSWLTPAASLQTITEAGEYVVTFSVVDGTAGQDFTVKPSRNIGTATIETYRGSGSWSGTFWLDWTATDVTNTDALIFVVTHNGGSTQSITLQFSITKVA